MSEENAEVETPEVSDPAKDTDWKAEARKWEARAKANSDAADKLKSIEDASKTEVQKMSDRLTEAQSKLKGYEDRDQIHGWATEIVKDSHVPAEALRGTTREELEAHFQQLKSLIPEPSNTDRTPVPSEGQGEGLALNGSGIEDALRRALGG